MPTGTSATREPLNCAFESYADSQSGQSEGLAATSRADPSLEFLIRNSRLKMNVRFINNKIVHPNWASRSPESALLAEKSE